MRFLLSQEQYDAEVRARAEECLRYMRERGDGFDSDEWISRAVQHHEYTQTMLASAHVLEHSANPHALTERGCRELLNREDVECVHDMVRLMARMAMHDDIEVKVEHLLEDGEWG